MKREHWDDQVDRLRGFAIRNGLILKKVARGHYVVHRKTCTRSPVRVHVHLWPGAGSVHGRIGAQRVNARVLGLETGWDIAEALPVVVRAVREERRR